MAFTYTIRKDGRLMKRVSVDGKIKTLYSDNVKDLERQYIEAKHLSNKGIIVDDEGITFNQETTLCGKSIINNITKAKNRGFFIELHYIGVESADIAKERVAGRMKQGGHGIAEQDIERRYIETFDNLKTVLPECDLAAFYDNTIEFRRFAIYKSGSPVRISHHVPDWYERFVADMT